MLRSVSAHRIGLRTFALSTPLAASRRRQTVDFIALPFAKLAGSSRSTGGRAHTGSPTNGSIASSHDNHSHSAAKFSSRAAQVAGHLQASSPSQSPSSPSHQTQSHPAMSRFTARRVGAPNTLEHRIYVEKDGVPISPFHDIPLYANDQQTVLNMIVEIPRWTNAKLEVSCLLWPSSSAHRIFERDLCAGVGLQSTCVVSASSLCGQWR